MILDRVEFRTWRRYAEESLDVWGLPNCGGGYRAYDAISSDDAVQTIAQIGQATVEATCEGVAEYSVGYLYTYTAAKGFLTPDGVGLSQVPAGDVSSADLAWRSIERKLFNFAGPHPDGADGLPNIQILRLGLIRFAPFVKKVTYDASIKEGFGGFWPHYIQAKASDALLDRVR